MAAAGSWADVLGEGRASRFALICLGVWLIAADALVTATIMPSVGRALNGYAWFGWATAGYMLASVMAGASAGLIVHRFGIRHSTAMAACLYVLGCGMSAAAPDIAVFLAGRVVQGLGGGWVVGFCSAAVGLMFPDRTLPKVYAAMTSVWGVASLIGPLIGGAFADAGIWRWVFWSFAIQGLAVAAAACVMLPKADAPKTDFRVAWAQLGLIGLGVASIGLADIAGGFQRTSLLTLIGIVLLLAMVWFDERAAVRLFPHGAGDLRTTAGAGYAAQFLLNAGSIGYSVYGPVLLQSLAGVGALTAGYIVAVEAMAWTVAGLLVANLTGLWPGRMILLGSVCILAGVGLNAMVFPTGSIPGVIVAGVLQGSGLGLSWAFMSQRILGSLAGDERTIGAVGISTVGMTSAAVGAAVAAAVANLVGVSHGLTQSVARDAGLWVFAAAVPVAAAGVIAAWRLTAKSPSEADEAATSAGR